MRRLWLIAAVAFVASASPAAAATRTEHVLTMDDGVPIAATLIEPDGAPPSGGWPAVVMMHGLAGSRRDVEPIATAALVPAGYSVLAFDARGHGASGGVVTVDGPREMGDVRAVFAWLRDRPEISDRAIGAWGISYGGGAAWRSAAEGVPWAAIETVQTWSDLYSALLPQNLARTGIIFGFLSSLRAPAPELTAIKDAAFAGRDLETVRTFARERSSRHLLSSLSIPSFLFQGRRDFAFGIDQATAAFRLLRGPKRLYIGPFGHPPSRFPGPDLERVITQGREWYDRFLKGIPNGIDTRPPVEVADAEGATTASYAGLPPTTRWTWRLRGTRTIADRGRVVRVTPPTPRFLETFGAPTVHVRATALNGWPRIVAVLTATPPRGEEVVVATGGVPARAGARTYTILLDDQATPIPKGSRLRVFLAADSIAQNPNNVVYLRLAFAPNARLRVGAARLTVPVLRRPVSRP